MTFDSFVALKSYSRSAAVHNVRLVDVQPNGAGLERLTVEHAGKTRDLPGAQWNEQLSRRDIGYVGYLVPASNVSNDLPEGSCYFRPYIDQSLRRVPDLDHGCLEANLTGGEPNVIGWYCDARPGGFRAPVGLIPGEEGGFVPDNTQAVVLRLPPEFLRECQRVQMKPENLLRSFVADLAGIQNLAACPRADRYSSGGSDEREMASEWLERAHGMNAIDLEEHEAREVESRERQDDRDDFAELLDEFRRHGGKAADLFKDVQSLVDKQVSADLNAGERHEGQ